MINNGDSALLELFIGTMVSLGMRQSMSKRICTSRFATTTSLGLLCADSVAELDREPGPEVSSLILANVGSELSPSSRLRSKKMISQ